MGHARPHRPTRRSGSLDLHLHRRGLGDVGLAALGAAALGRLRPARRVVAEVEGAAALAEAEEAREATEAAEHDAAEAVVLVDGEPQVALCRPVAHVDRVEARGVKLLPRHPEGAVVLVLGLEPHLDDGVVRPLLGAIAPRALPLVPPPRVAQLDQPRLAEQPRAEVEARDQPELACVEDGVGMRADQPGAVVELLAVEAAAVGRAAAAQVLAHVLAARRGDERARLHIVEDQVPHVVLGVLLVGRVEAAVRRLLAALGLERPPPPLRARLLEREPEAVVAGEDGPAPDGPAAVERRVRAAELGERLLEQHRPQLLSVAPD
eukprot:4468819-Prymnesium_polylepis.1